METVKTWGVSTCAVIIIASVVSMIVPNISGKNIMRLIISGFILVGILSSFFKFLKSDSFSTEALSLSYDNITVSDGDIYSDEIAQSLEEYVVGALYPLIDEELEKLGVYDEFGLSVKLGEKNDGIEIESVHIALSHQHKNNMDILKEKLEEKLGLKIYIDVTKPEGN